MSDTDDPVGGPTSVFKASGKGVLIVIGAVVVGVLLLPSATRAPRLAAMPAAKTPTTVPHHRATHPTTTTTTPPPAPATVHVLAANGSGVNGAAGDVTTLLQSKGFGTLQATNATAQVTASAVYPASASNAPAAEEVASVLGLPATDVEVSGTPPVQSASGADVIVIVGPELAAAVTHTTTTTAASGSPASG